MQTPLIFNFKDITNLYLNKQLQDYEINSSILTRKPYDLGGFKKLYAIKYDSKTNYTDIKDILLVSDDVIYQIKNVFNFILMDKFKNNYELFEQYRIGKTDKYVIPELIIENALKMINANGKLLLYKLKFVNFTICSPTNIPEIEYTELFQISHADSNRIRKLAFIIFSYSTNNIVALPNNNNTVGGGKNKKTKTKPKPKPKAKSNKK